MEKQSVLRSGRVTLRAMEPQDEAAAVAILRSGKVAETFMLPDFADDAQAAALFGRLMRLSQDAEKFVYGAYADGALVGFINEVDRDGDAVEVGYAVHPDCWNRGYATEMLRAAVGELFRMGVGEVRAGYFEGNDASRRVMEKCGLLPVGREETIEYRGRRHRCLYCAIRKD